MRSKRKQEWSDVPSRGVIRSAHAAAMLLKRNQSHQDGRLGQFSSCKVWGNAGGYGSGPVSGSPDMSETRKNSNYSKWEVMPFKMLRKEAQYHFMQMEGVALYKMDGNKLEDMVCIRHSLKSEAWSLEAFWVCWDQGFLPESFSMSIFRIQWYGSLHVRQICWYKFL